jgi:hypothetical protein
MRRRLSHGSLHTSGCSAVTWRDQQRQRQQRISRAARVRRAAQRLRRLRRSGCGLQCCQNVCRRGRRQAQQLLQKLQQRHLVRAHCLHRLLLLRRLWRALGDAEGRMLRMLRGLARLRAATSGRVRAARRRRTHVCAGKQQSCGLAAGRAKLRARGKVRGAVSAREPL